MKRKNIRIFLAGIKRDGENLEKRVGKPIKPTIMKNFKLLLAAVVVFGAGSAFTTAKEKTAEQVYVDVDGIRTPIEQADGKCECQYTLDGDTPVPRDSNSHFESN